MEQVRPGEPADARHGSWPAGPVVIAGGSGFLGLSLSRHLAMAGAKIVILSRSTPRVPGPWTHVAWDGRSLDGEWERCLDGASGLVNLTGRSVDCRKTPEHMDEILRSRVEPIRVLGEALRRLPHVRPHALANAATPQRRNAATPQRMRRRAWTDRSGAHGQEPSSHQGLFGWNWVEA